MRSHRARRKSGRGKHTPPQQAQEPERSPPATWSTRARQGHWKERRQGKDIHATHPTTRRGRARGHPTLGEASATSTTGPNGANARGKAETRILNNRHRDTDRTRRQYYSQRGKARTREPNNNHQEKARARGRLYDQLRTYVGLLHNCLRGKTRPRIPNYSRQDKPRD